MIFHDLVTFGLTTNQPQQGGLIADPDMEFEVVSDLWFPVAIQHATGHYYRAIDYRDGKRVVNPGQTRDQQSFARLWGRNLLAQGFARGKILRAEAC